MGRKRIENEQVDEFRCDYTRIFLLGLSKIGGECAMQSEGSSRSRMSNVDRWEICSYLIESDVYVYKITKYKRRIY